MSEKENKAAQSLGEFSMTFKGRKPEDGDIAPQGKKKRYRAKGEVVSGASKMRAAYKTRIANKGKKSAKKKR
ncbi:MAG: hypothetical protein SNH79_00585 [Rikenellaceae bacterium]